MAEATKRRLGIVLYPGFELLDVFGPAEMFGILGIVDVEMVAERSGAVKSAQGPEILARYGFDDAPQLDLLLVPGGIGTRDEIDNSKLIEFLRRRAGIAEVAMSVCTGSALFARAGVLDGRRATTNKMSFQWVADQGPEVHWVKEARWVEDDKLATSSGVSAGMDMALAVIARLYGEEVSNNVAIAAEYDWHRNAGWDPFARVHGLVG